MNEPSKYSPERLPGSNPSHQGIPNGSSYPRQYPRTRCGATTHTKQLARDILMQWRLAQADVPAETAMTGLRRLMNRPVEPLALTVVLAACGATLLLHMFLMVMP